MLKVTMSAPVILTVDETIGRASIKVGDLIVLDFDFDELEYGFSKKASRGAPLPRSTKTVEEAKEELKVPSVPLKTPLTATQPDPPSPDYPEPIPKGGTLPGADPVPFSPKPGYYGPIRKG